MHCCCKGTRNSPGTTVSPCPATPGTRPWQMSWVACRQSSKASAGGWGCLEKKEGPFLRWGCATRVQLTILAQQAHPPGPHWAAGSGAAGGAGRAELSGPAGLSGKEMSKSRGPGREREERDSRAPPGTSVEPLLPPQLPPPPPSLCLSFPKGAWPPTLGLVGGKVEVKLGHALCGVLSRAG